jgi:hypothetical protein
MVDMGKFQARQKNIYQYISSIRILCTYALQVVAVEPGGNAGHLLAKSDDLFAATTAALLAGIGEGDKGQDYGHDENGELSDLHDDFVLGSCEVGLRWLEEFLEDGS